MLAMMADNIEHVVSYWLLFQKFSFTALAGFADIAHWTPFLLFSVFFGGLADRRDCRKLIQIAQVLFMGCRRPGHPSLYEHDSGVARGCAADHSRNCRSHLGAREQVLIHDIVGAEDPSQCRSTECDEPAARILFGPAVGAG
jgi:hypothetical protein